MVLLYFIFKSPDDDISYIETLFEILIKCANYCNTMKTSTNKLLTLWLSKIILKVIPADTKTVFRNYERNSRKLVTSYSHRKFNESCLNIYIYIYISTTVICRWWWSGAKICN